jgi:hypothetical protein
VIVLAGSRPSEQAQLALEEKCGLTSDSGSILKTDITTCISVWQFVGEPLAFRKTYIADFATLISS